MIKKVVVFGLWYQWKQFLNYFLKNNFEVYWICKTLETKDKIEKEFWIQVFTDYKKILNNNIDLMVLCAYPIDIYEEVIEFSKKYNFKILADLPISFSEDFLQKNIWNKQLFLFNLETKLPIFKIIKEDIENIIKSEAILYINDYNIWNKNWVLVDLQYLVNNLLLLDLKKISFKTIYVNRDIKNIEYIIKIFLKDKVILYKYEDWFWKIIYMDYEKNILKIQKNKIIYDEIISSFISDINNNSQKYHKEYMQKFIYLLWKYV